MRYTLTCWPYEFLQWLFDTRPSIDFSLFGPFDVCFWPLSEPDATPTRIAVQLISEPLTAALVVPYITAWPLLTVRADTRSIEYGAWLSNVRLPLITSGLARLQDAQPLYIYLLSLDIFS